MTGIPFTSPFMVTIVLCDLGDDEPVATQLEDDPLVNRHGGSYVEAHQNLLRDTSFALQIHRNPTRLRAMSM